MYFGILNDSLPLGDLRLEKNEEMIHRSFVCRRKRREFVLAFFRSLSLKRMSSALNLELELYRLIWLDRRCQSTEDNRRTQEKLREKIPYLRTFEECSSCLKYLRDDLDGEKVLLVASGSLGAEIIDRLQPLKCVLGVFVFCLDKERNELWAKNYSKVKGVFVLEDDLLRALSISCLSEESQLHHCLTPLPVRDEDILCQLHQIDCSLVDRRDLLEVLREMYALNPFELVEIDELEHLYQSSKSLNWFVEERFLFRLLIRSLEDFRVEMLYLLRFFLQDLDDELKKCPSMSPSERLYRGQLCRSSDVEDWTERDEEKTFRWKGFFIASNNEKKIRDLLLAQSTTDEEEKDLQRLLFVVQPTTEAKELREKKIIVFPLQTEFRRLSIRLENRVWIVTLAVVVVSPTETTTKKIDPLEFVHHLRTIGRYLDAELLFHRLLNHYPHRQSLCYDGLARLAEDRDDLQLSEEFFLLALQCVSTNKDRSHLLNNLGCLYDTRGDHQRSRDFYSQALALIKDNADRSMSLNNLAVSFAKSNEVDQALICFKESLTLQKRSVGKKHFFVGIVYTNLAVLYSSLRQIDRSIEYYSKAFPLFLHPDLKSLLFINLAQTFELKEDFSQALVFYGHAQQFFQHYRTSDHPTTIFIQQQIERIKQQGISLV